MSEQMDKPQDIVERLLAKQRRCKGTQQQATWFLCADAMAEITRLRSERPAMDGWRPIESAPKDRFIFLWCPEDQSRWLAKYQGGDWYGVDDEGLTRTGGSPETHVNGWIVTHWQPLPSPPGESK